MVAFIASDYQHFNQNDPCSFKVIWYNERILCLVVKHDFSVYMLLLQFREVCSTIKKQKAIEQILPFSAPSSGQNLKLRLFVTCDKIFMKACHAEVLRVGHVFCLFLLGLLRNIFRCNEYIRLKDMKLTNLTVYKGMLIPNHWLS